MKPCLNGTATKRAALPGSSVSTERCLPVVWNAPVELLDCATLYRE